MFKDILISLFFIVMTVFFYAASLKINEKYKIAAFNPIMISAFFIIVLLTVLKIPYEKYNMGGKIIAGALGPIVVVLAIPLYKNRIELMKNFVPIIGGVAASIITSFVSVIILCRLFKIDQTIFLSLLSKSITTPMAVHKAYGWK